MHLSMAQISGVVMRARPLLHAEVSLDVGATRHVGPPLPQYGEDKGGGGSPAISELSPPPPKKSNIY